MPHHIVVSGKYSHPSHPFVCILDRGSTASFLACVSNFLQLASIQLLIQDPTVYERPRDCNILSSAFQILSHVRSGPLLRKVGLWLNPYAIAIPSSPRRFSYNLTRAGFLGALCGPQIRDALELFPSLEIFSLSLQRTTGNTMPGGGTTGLGNACLRFRTSWRSRWTATTEPVRQSLRFCRTEPLR